MTAEFLPNINVPLKPFQGTLGVAPPDGYYPPISRGYQLPFLPDLMLATWI